jgi:malonate transporter
MMILNNLFPVFALIGLGALLKHIHLTGERFLKASDRLVYFIFFPVMLFWKIGASPSADNSATDLIVAAICAVATVYLICHLYETVQGVNFCRRLFFTVLLSVQHLRGNGCHFKRIGRDRCIAVRHSDRIPHTHYQRAGRIHLDLVLRPGHRYAPAVANHPARPDFQSADHRLPGRYGLFAVCRCIPGFLDNTFRLAAMVALPLALLSIGGTLTVKNIKAHLGHAFLGSAIKLLVLPTVGWFFLKAVDASPSLLSGGHALFRLPASPAIIVLSSQLNSDTEFASAAIVLSTLLSFFSMSAVLLMF